MIERKVIGYIRTYSRETRDEIVEVAYNFLTKAGFSKDSIEAISTGLLSCVDELIKNAVKANYKFLLVYEKIFNQLQDYAGSDTKEARHNKILEMMKRQEQFDSIADDVIKKYNISAEVREILNEEAKFLAIKNKVYLEQRNFSPEEIEKLKTYKKINEIRKKLKENDIKIILKVQADDDFIYFEITNTAPMFTKDLERVYSKREEYCKYKEQGIEHEFFINNLDTSESGFGLGYATIDSILSGWGLNTDRALTIISSIDTTVMLTLPIEQLALG